MKTALHAKFTTYPDLQDFLLSTAGAVLVEASQNDKFWGAGRHGDGENKLGQMLMELRSEIAQSTNWEPNGSPRLPGSAAPLF